MNMMKKNGGFTLVELIVVIAILAILAGVAVPAYSGYIKKAQDAAVITELDAIATAAQAANATAGEINGITVASPANGVQTVTVTVASGETLADDFNDDFKLFIDDAADLATAVDGKLNVPTISNWDNSSYKGKTATWAAGEWTAQ